jgi:hypothetical protein
VRNVLGATRNWTSAAAVFVRYGIAFALDAAKRKKVQESRRIQKALNKAAINVEPRRWG